MSVLCPAKSAYFGKGGLEGLKCMVGYAEDAIGGRAKTCVR
jgi:hypothetical protein